MKKKEIIEKMTLEEKTAFCTGGDFWHTKAMPSYGVPQIMMCDGPHGLRCQKGNTDMIGVNDSLPATCFPTAVTAGASWNEELYAAEGAAIGKEALAEDVQLVLGPGCNIKRNPLCGRNFEYLSEDPYFAGKMAAAFIRGQQSTGASSSLKHFAVNSQEYKRQNGDSQLDKRTLREIYLTPFEIAVKEGKPDTVMCAYNKINGVHCSDNKKLLTDILRKEWGFDGMVVTDWGALRDRIEAFHAGCDLNMPGGSHYMEKEVLDAVRKGTLSEQEIDASVERILCLVEKSQERNKRVEKVDFDRHHALARKIAEQGAVLLKNEEQILPLKSKDLVLIGAMAERMRYQGSGSSHINPTRQSSLTGQMPEVPFVACCDDAGNVTEASLREAAEAAKKHKIAIVVAGLPEAYESEAFDREHMRLPKGHLRMIDAVASANPDTVVILLGGSAMEVPFADKVKAILYMGLAGQAAGEAAYHLLTGQAVPCGKLTETWPFSYQDVISAETFGKKNVEYREGIYVGYRYYDKAQKAVRYPFGHGLSYTEFAYSDLEIRNDQVFVTIANTGARDGAEVAQLYLQPPKNAVGRPQKELKGFVRVELKAGESKRVSFALQDRSFAIWKNDGWVVPKGRYTILVGASSRDIRLSGELEVPGVELHTPKWLENSWYETLSGKPQRKEWEQLMGHAVPLAREAKKGEFTLDNTCLEMKDSSLVMKIQYKVTEFIVARSYGGKRDLSNSSYRMMLTCAVDCPLRASIISSGGALPDSVANGLLAMANGHYIKGIVIMLKGL